MRILLAGVLLCALLSGCEKRSETPKETFSFDDLELTEYVPDAAIQDARLRLQNDTGKCTVLTGVEAQQRKVSLVFLGMAQNRLASFDRRLAMKIEPQEQVVDALVREVKSRHIRRLRDGLCSVEYGFVLEDLLTAFERSADHCSNVGVEILQVAEGKLEAHEYLNSLKSGQLQESAAFAEQFARYKAKYAFPEE